MIAKPQTPSNDAGDLVKRLEKDLAVSPLTWPSSWPGSSALTPSAFGGVRGMIGVGLGLQPGTRYDHSRRDGVFGVSVPVGDPMKSIGFDVIGTLTNLDDLSGRGTFDFMVHKRFNDVAVAFGTERLSSWGGSDTDRTVYLVGSKRLRLKESSLSPFSRATVSLGFGNGRFRREADVFADKKTIGVFASGSINVLQQLNAFAEWTGQDLDLGLSFSPIRDVPLVITAAAVDLTGSAGDGVRSTFGLGYVFRFR